jgi:hypothetical protein
MTHVSPPSQYPAPATLAMSFRTNVYYQVIYAPWSPWHGRRIPGPYPIYIMMFPNQYPYLDCRIQFFVCILNA